MDVGGALTGIRVIEYHESLKSSRGDFLSPPRFLGQFGGKRITDPFRVRRDVDGISGATITASAMSLGIRNAARRVAAAYLSGAPPGGGAPARYIGSISLEELQPLSWADLLGRGMARQLAIEEVTVAVAFLRDARVGELLMGSTRFSEALAKAGERADDRHRMVLGIDGPRALGPLPKLFFVQDADTIRVGQSDFVDAGTIAEGPLEGVFRRPGLLLVDRALDVTAPFQVGLQRCCGAAPVVTEYVVHEPVAALASAPRPEAPRPAPPAPPPALSAEGLAAVRSLERVDEESALARTLARTSWARVAALVLLLALAAWSFAAKRVALRWVTLGGTAVFLGFIDGGFLSVSHIISGIAAGPEVFLGDLPLLILVTFTLVTTLLWGRVFCGFLCPFGALQDGLERIVPKRFRRALSRPAHDRAALVKYAILALVLAPALLGARLSLFQYFEPFGTVFFWSRSVLLWTIAITILAASAVVPRFYCRYACPLGAALALGSLLSPFRIRRVEQCKVCKVCEQGCPTGAIRGPDIDFKECVRCNACEINLSERRGSCRHDMEEIRSRLVPLRRAPHRLVDGAALPSN